MAAPPAGDAAGARSGLRLLTFEVGEHLLAVRADAVARVVGWGQALPEGTAVVDLVGLLAASGARSRRECVILLAAPESRRPPVAVSASRAREVVSLGGEVPLPLPGYLFRGGNPFLGLIPPAPPGRPQALFLLKEPERLLASAGPL
jgi:hypothetical protein